MKALARTCLVWWGLYALAIALVIVCDVFEPGIADCHCDDFANCGLFDLEMAGYALTALCGFWSGWRYRGLARWGRWMCGCCWGLAAAGLEMCGVVQSMGTETWIAHGVECEVLVSSAVMLAFVATGMLCLWNAIASTNRLRWFLALAVVVFLGWGGMSVLLNGRYWHCLKNWIL